MILSIPLLSRKSINIMAEEEKAIRLEAEADAKMKSADGFFSKMFG